MISRIFHADAKPTGIRLGKVEVSILVCRRPSFTLQLPLAVIEPGQELEYPLAGRHAWLQVLRGNVNAGGEALATGDGLALSDERQLHVTAGDEAEVLLFDLA